MFKSLVTRVSKHQKIYERNRQFQISYDFEGLAREVKAQKNKIYVEPEAHELLKTVTNTGLLNQQTKFKYQTREQYVKRITEEKQKEKQRKDKIFAEQQYLIDEAKRKEEAHLKAMLDQKK